MEKNTEVVLGQVLGELRGIREQIAQANSDTHRRIDDLAESVRQQTASINRRLDDHQKDTDSRFEEMTKRVKTAEENATKAMTIATEAKLNKTQIATTSGGASAVMIAVAEIIKTMSL